VIEKATEDFRLHFDAEPTVVVRAPGRVNLLGEHVDYNDGWVLPVAIDRAAYVVASPRADRLARIDAADLDARVTLDLRRLDNKCDTIGRPLAGWARYPAGVAAALQARHLDVPGIDALIRSSVPIGAGLSSSAAVEVALALAWSATGDWKLSPTELVLACRAAENDYVGVSCGIMDQLASACGRKDHALLIDCRTLEWRTIALPAGVAIVVADTGVRRHLASGAFNERRLECEEAVRHLRGMLPDIRALRDVSIAELDRCSARLPGRLLARARHVVEECQRVRRGAELLESADLDAFGKLLDEAHESLRDFYEVSCPELDAMASAARRIDGCFGARLTGAGFGGCTVALVREEAAQAFSATLAREYERTTGRRAVIEVCRASDGATVERECDDESAG
jgi:galactokinase